MNPTRHETEMDVVKDAAIASVFERAYAAPEPSDRELEEGWQQFQEMYQDKLSTTNEDQTNTKIGFVLIPALTLAVTFMIHVLPMTSLVTPSQNVAHIVWNLSVEKN